MKRRRRSKAAMVAFAAALAVAGLVGTYWILATRGAPTYVIQYDLVDAIGDAVIELSSRAKNDADPDPSPQGLEYALRQAIKQGSSIRKEYTRALIAPIGSAYRYSLAIAPGARLRARYGFDLEAGTPRTARATFEIRIDNGDADRVLYSRTISSADQQRFGRLYEIDLPLPDRMGEAANLELRVSGAMGRPDDPSIPADEMSVPAVWGAPRILMPVGDRTDRPNVIIISVDTLRPDAIGPYEPERENATPALSSFGSRAIRFDQAFAVSPWTMPSHFSLLTGVYPSRHGLNRAFGDTRARADGSVATLAELLRNAGYLTVAIASDRALDPEFGFKRGFHFFSDNPVREAAPLLPQVDAFVRKHHRERFFLFFHSYDPHGPLFRAAAGAASSSGRLGGQVDYESFLALGPPTATETSYLRRLYDNHVAHYDEFFGKLVDLLGRFELFDDSIIIVTSDHGEELFERTAYLHGHTLYDEMLRVPLLIKFPGEAIAPRSVEALTALIDVVPSILDYLDIDAPASLDGASFMDVIGGSRDHHRTHFLAEALAWGPERKAVRTDRFKYIVTLPESAIPHLSPRSNHYDRLFDTTAREELYRLTDDPGELHNVIDDYPRPAHRFRELTAALIEMKPRTGPAIEWDDGRLEALRSLGYVSD